MSHPPLALAPAQEHTQSRPRSANMGQPGFTPTGGRSWGRPLQRLSLAISNLSQLLAHKPIPKSLPHNKKDIFCRPDKYKQV